MSNRYDVIIVGGGHAGCEAAAAAARMGVDVALVTMRRDRIGEMSAIRPLAGLGKAILCARLTRWTALWPWLLTARAFSSAC